LGDKERSFIWFFRGVLNSIKNGNGGYRRRYQKKKEAGELFLYYFYDWLKHVFMASFFRDGFLGVEVHVLRACPFIS